VDFNHLAVDANTYMYPAPKTGTKRKKKRDTFRAEHMISYSYTLYGLV
jgi:hypothetical protein